MASKLLRWERSTPMTADANIGKALSSLRSATSRRSQAKRSDLHHVAVHLSTSNHSDSLGNGKSSCDWRLYHEAPNHPRSTEVSASSEMNTCTTQAKVAKRHYHIVRKDLLARLAEGFDQEQVLPSTSGFDGSLSVLHVCYGGAGCSQRWRLAVRTFRKVLISLEWHWRGFRVDVSLLLSREWKILRQVDKLVGSVRLKTQVKL